MSDMLSLRLPEDLSERLTRLSEATSRPKSFYVRTLLEEHLAEWEYVAGLDAEVQDLRRGTLEPRPLDELAEQLGFDPEQLRHDARIGTDS